MEQNFDKDIYIIDLSYAVSASDIVFELSSIIDNDMAKNQKIALKLGNVDLNQSQLLSICSLINSINSTVEFLETNSAQTELSATNLGIIVSTVKSSNNVKNNNVEPSEPTLVASYEYVKLEDHLPEEEEEDNEADDETEEDDINSVGISSTQDETLQQEIEDFSSNPEKTEEYAILQDEINCDTVISEEEAEEIIEAKSEEIQNALDNIYATEVKLETILEAEPEKEIDKEAGIISSETVKKALLNEEKYTEADFEIDHFSTTYVKQTLRSGQIVNYDGNVVIIGDCHPGSEVIASGDITVWGILSGIAHAGAKGNPRAKVRALKMNAIQLRIANHYARKPDGMNTIFPERTSTFTPEEARVINNEIVIFKIND